MKINMVYITAKNKEEAKRIGKAVVEGRLAACANIIDNMNSIYWWKDKIEYDNEAILIVKTKEALVAELIEKVKALHGYECPCIVSLPILAGNQPYLEWIEKETK